MVHGFQTLNASVDIAVVNTHKTTGLKKTKTSLPAIVITGHSRLLIVYSTLIFYISSLFHISVELISLCRRRFVSYSTVSIATASRHLMPFAEYLIQQKKKISQ